MNNLITFTWKISLEIVGEVPIKKSKLDVDVEDFLPNQLTTGCNAELDIFSHFQRDFLTEKASSDLGSEHLIKGQYRQAISFT